MNLPIKFWLVLFFLPFTGSGQSLHKVEAEKRLFTQIDKYIQAQIDTAKESPVPGISIAIVKGKELIHLKGFGVANIKTKQPLKSDNTFHVASVTKTFTATSILQLIERKKLRLDEKLTHYLPYFSMADKRYRDITIRQVLNHTSGMPDVEEYEWEKAVADKGAAERWTRSLTNQTLLATPGTAYHYSNMAYDVLADVVAKVTGKPFEQYVKETILQPLQMVRSSLLLPEVSSSWRTSPHTGIPLKVNSVYPYNRMHSASGTLNTNVIDLSHWMIANLNEGVYKTSRILSAASIALMQTPTFQIDSSSRQAIGLSWFIYPYRGVNLVNHDGRDDGYVSVLCLIPSRQLGFVILCNSDEADSYTMKNEVLNMLLSSDI
ncbi:serine hydrolase domain-containing protein [Fibrella aquatilis]|uniref:Beta-lactamase family protein n=1 Tax=Fibrella aquatilis TaxID=2817059 RepID=A0A939G1I8_9BACT|nr:serine hydrolase domain-containing protein [Fibrella aquatilis]MBO0929375.1 beta-lactamase family protein [Fibrella aquatilis]